MLRRFWVRKVVLLAAVVWLPTRQAMSQEGHSLNSAELLRNGRNVVPLIDQLTNGLRASRPADIQFLEVVVQHVDQGRLPQGMINLVYRWAINRNPRVPFPYFQLAMRELSRRRGVQLP